MYLQKKSTLVATFSIIRVVQLYSVFHRFGQAKFAYDGSIFCCCPSCLKIWCFLKKIVKTDSKVIILLDKFKSTKQAAVYDKIACNCQTQVYLSHILPFRFHPYVYESLRGSNPKKHILFSSKSFYTQILENALLQFILKPTIKY